MKHHVLWVAACETLPFTWCLVVPIPMLQHAGAARHAAAQAALQCMQLLHAAGYAPSVYRNVRVADTRGALGHLQGLPEVLAELDPFDEQLNLFPDWVKQTRCGGSNDLLAGTGLLLCGMMGWATSALRQ